MKINVFIFIVNLLSISTFAQRVISEAEIERQQREVVVKSEDNTPVCKGFKMPIIVPSDQFEAAMIVTPDENSNYKIRSVDPCLVITSTVPGIEIINLPFEKNIVPIPKNLKMPLYKTDER